MGDSDTQRDWWRDPSIYPEGGGCWDCGTGGKGPKGPDGYWCHAHNVARCERINADFAALEAKFLAMGGSDD